MTDKWIRELHTDPDSRRLLEQERVLVEVTENIARLMDEIGVSRADLARRLGKSPAFITKVLQGRHNFTLRTASDILFALGQSLHVSLGEIGDGVHMCPMHPPKELKLDGTRWTRQPTVWRTPAIKGCNLSELKELAA